MGDDSLRQAGANQTGESESALTSDFLEPVRLSFDTEEDALSYFSELAEDFSSWLAAKPRNIVEDYLNGRVHLRVVFRARSNATEGKLALHIIPLADRVEAGVANVAVSSANPLADQRDGLKDTVDFTVPDLVQLPQGVFPPLVRLECDQEGANCLGDFTVLVSIQVGFRLGLSLPEWELGELGFGLSADCASAVEDRMVKGGSKAVDDVEGDRGKILGCLSNSNLKQLFSGFRIILTESSVWLIGDEAALDRIEIVEVLLRSTDQQS